MQREMMGVSAASAASSRLTFILRVSQQRRLYARSACEMRTVAAET